MSKTWNDSVKRIIDNNLKAKEFNELSNNIVTNWIQEENDICLKLRKNYNKKISVQLNSEEKKSPHKRITTLINELKLNNKELYSPIKIIEKIEQVIITFYENLIEPLIV